MKHEKIPDEHLKMVADMLPKISNGIHKKVKSVLGKNLTKKEVESVKKIFSTTQIIHTKLYNWTEFEQLYLNHFEALKRIAKKEGMPGVEQYTIDIKSKNIKNIQKR